MSPAINSTLFKPLMVCASSPTSSGSFSMATTWRQRLASSRVIAPLPAPRSSTVSAFVIPECKTRDSISRPSRRKFCDSDLLRQIQSPIDDGSLKGGPRLFVLMTCSTKSPARKKKRATDVRYTCGPLGKSPGKTPVIRCKASRYCHDGQQRTNLEVGSQNGFTGRKQSLMTYGANRVTGA